MTKIDHVSITQYGKKKTITIWRGEPSKTYSNVTNASLARLGMWTWMHNAKITIQLSREYTSAWFSVIARPTSSRK